MFTQVTIKNTTKSHKLKKLQEFGFYKYFLFYFSEYIVATIVFIIFGILAATGALISSCQQLTSGEFSFAPRCRAFTIFYILAGKSPKFPIEQNFVCCLFPNLDYSSQIHLLFRPDFILFDCLVNLAFP